MQPVSVQEDVVGEVTGTHQERRHLSLEFIDDVTVLSAWEVDSSVPVLRTSYDLAVATP